MDHTKYIPSMEFSSGYILAQSGINGTYINEETNKVDQARFCSAESPCVDGSCCNSDGLCGFRKEHCRPDPPATCVSNCEATAECGVNSKDSNTTCPNDLCCSYFGWCGTSELHCSDVGPTGRKTPVQRQYGSARAASLPECGEDSGTASTGRTVGYYQGSNVRHRRCNQIWPQHLNMRGLTHIVYGYAAIDPKTFDMIPEHPSDPTMYSLFVQHKYAGVQPWIAVGGWQFSSEGPTHRTWSDMVSNPANRRKFISSAITFMNIYGFQGIDLAWESPGIDGRGGRSGDKANFVDLLKEFREQMSTIGLQYGVSVLVPGEPGYSIEYDFKGMEPYVDWFNLASYDLRGHWDAFNGWGTQMRSHTDVRIIEDDLKIYAQAGVEFKKMNLGVSWYGRGYTIKDPNCKSLDSCHFSGPSVSITGTCTNKEGVLSNHEIRSILRAKLKLDPTYHQDAKVQVLTYDDQLIAYDDQYSLAKKVNLANNRCMGGTVIWSLEYDMGVGVNAGIDGQTGGVGQEWSEAPVPIGGGQGDQSGGGQNGSGQGGQNGQEGGQGGDAGGFTGSGMKGTGDYYPPPLVYADPNAEVRCEPPCTIYLPPFPLPSPTTITLPPYTTVLFSITGGTTKETTVTYSTINDGIPTITSQVGDMIADGTAVPFTTVITLPPVTTHEINFWPIPVPSSTAVADYTPVISFQPPEIPITVPPAVGTFPPFKYINPPSNLSMIPMPTGGPLGPAFYIPKGTRTIPLAPHPTTPWSMDLSTPQAMNPPLWWKDTYKNTDWLSDIANGGYQPSEGVFPIPEGGLRFPPHVNIHLGPPEASCMFPAMCGTKHCGIYDFAWCPSLDYDPSYPPVFPLEPPGGTEFPPRNGNDNSGGGGDPERDGDGGDGGLDEPCKPCPSGLPGGGGIPCMHPLCLAGAILSDCVSCEPGLPGLPGLPGFPSVPKVPPLQGIGGPPGFGGFSSPPKGYETQPNNPEPGPNPDPNPDPMPDRDDDRDKSSSSYSSSSSCTQTTATKFLVSCASSGSSSTCSTVSSLETKGCSVQPTTTTMSCTGQTTVSNLWVTCSGTSCTTTSTAVTSACAVTATTATENPGSCSGAPLDPLEDQL